MATIKGTSGNDTLTGTVDDDLFIFTTGNDSLDGGAGFDIMDFSTAGSGILINGLGGSGALYSLLNGTFINRPMGNIEGVIGTDFDDFINGNAGDNFIDGGAGDDDLTGGLGNDTFLGSVGSDTIDGGGTASNPGLDVVDYSWETGNIFADLAGGVKTVTPGGGLTGPDQLSRIEGLIGGSGNDALTGNADDNLFDGGAGDDTLTLGDGADTVISSTGSDEIDGGAGTDTYQVQTNDNYVFTGSDPGGFTLLGTTAAGLGDIDGDGIADFAMSSYGGSGTGTPATFIVSGADLAQMDDVTASGGTAVDGNILSSDITQGASSYQFVDSGAGSFGFTSLDIVGSGDFDGDGRADFIIGDSSANSTSGHTYLIYGDELALLDNESGTAGDGIIDVADIAGTSGNSLQFVGEDAGDAAGFSVDIVDDIDGDGLDDLLIGARTAEVTGTSNEGHTYLISSADFGTLDGNGDDVIDLGNVAGSTNSYEFRGEDASGATGHSVRSVGDIDGDGLSDFFIGAPVGDVTGTNDTGEGFLIFSSDLETLDTASGSNDNVIELADVGAVGTTSYRFEGIDNDDQAGSNIEVIGDLDGDGLNEFIIAAREGDAGGFDSGEMYLINGADLAALDNASTAGDRVIDLADVAGTGSSYQINGTEILEKVGPTIESLGDIDGDGISDFAIGSPYVDGATFAEGATYIISGRELANLDAASGTDGIIELDNVAAANNSFVLEGQNSGTYSGYSVANAGDVDGDGINDILVTATYLNGAAAGSYDGKTFLISGDNLDALDAADGTVNGTISLSNVDSMARQNATVAVNDQGDGTAVINGETDTLTSVENFVAEEKDGVIDAITITSTGAGFTSADVADLDDATAVGTFTRASDGQQFNFGPGGTGAGFDGELSEYLDSEGTIQITGGDETGSVGGISFENFETINFDVVCFTRGTMILTRHGEVAIEDLKAGDRVLTLDNGYQPLQWIGSVKVDSIDLAAHPRLKPILIRADALAPGLPARDLMVSPQHRVLVRSKIAQRMFGELEILVPANKLLALPGIDIVEDGEAVEYFHMLFEHHEVVFSNGAPTETLFTGPEAMKAVSPEARAEIAALFPEILDESFEPTAARLIPRKGKHIKKMAYRMRENDKSVVDMDIRA